MQPVLVVEFQESLQALHLVKGQQGLKCVKGAGEHGFHAERGEASPCLPVMQGNAVVDRHGGVGIAHIHTTACMREKGDK